MYARGCLPYFEAEYSAQPVMRDDASIVPYKLFAAFAAKRKFSPRRDEGIAPY